MPSWLKWGFWVCPLSYGEIGLTVNEFLSPRWNKVNWRHFIKLLNYLTVFIFLKLLKADNVDKHNHRETNTSKPWTRF